MFQFDEERLPADIRVIGVGGGGSNAVSTMARSEVRGVKFMVANTDMQALERSPAPIKLQIGSKLTRGRGAGANPEVGKKAAEEDADKIKSALDGAELVFITAGMGGGTGTGAAPVIANYAREMGALVVGVVTKPFLFEGARRMKYANEGIEELKKNVDALIIIPNNKILGLAEKNTTTLEAFKMADSVLVHAVKGISDVVMEHGHVNVDFADVRTVLSNRGRAVMGTGLGSGSGRAVDATQMAISSPLLEDGSIKGATHVLVNITGGNDISMLEQEEAMQIIQKEVDPDALIVIGMVINPVMHDDVMVTVIATGFDDENSRTKLVKPITTLEDYRKTTISRPKQQPRTQGDLFSGNANGYDADDLDIPTYLRQRRAD